MYGFLPSLSQHTVKSVCPFGLETHRSKNASTKGRHPRGETSRHFVRGHIVQGRKFIAFFFVYEFCILCKSYAQEGKLWWMRDDKVFTHKNLTKRLISESLNKGRENTIEGSFRNRIIALSPSPPPLPPPPIFYKRSLDR